MNVLLMGPPGSGKGTQGEVLAARLQIRHIAAGDLLRAEVDEATELGQRVQGYLDRGELVPDEVMVELVVPKAVAAAVAGGYLLDGFPRTYEQTQLAAAWRFEGREEEVAAPDAVIVLEADADVLVARALERGRDDDTEDVVRRRLSIYENETAPVVEFFRDRGITHTVDATMTVEQVSDAILSELDVPRA